MRGVLPLCSDSVGIFFSHIRLGLDLEWLFVRVPSFDKIDLSENY